jgi:hypothetical protein
VKNRIFLVLGDYSKIIMGLKLIFKVELKFGDIFGNIKFGPGLFYEI